MINNLNSFIANKDNIAEIILKENINNSINHIYLYVNQINNNKITENSLYIKMNEILVKNTTNINLLYYFLKNANNFNNLETKWFNFFHSKYDLEYKKRQEYKLILNPILKKISKIIFNNIGFNILIKKIFKIEYKKDNNFNFYYTNEPKFLKNSMEMLLIIVQNLKLLENFETSFYNVLINSIYEIKIEFEDKNINDYLNQALFFFNSIYDKVNHLFLKFKIEKNNDIIQNYKLKLIKNIELRKNKHIFNNNILQFNKEKEQEKIWLKEILLNQINQKKIKNKYLKELNILYEKKLLLREEIKYQESLRNDILKNTFDIDFKKENIINEIDINLNSNENNLNLSFNNNNYNLKNNLENNNYKSDGNELQYINNKEEVLDFENLNKIKIKFYEISDNSVYKLSHFYKICIDQIIKNQYLLSNKIILFVFLEKLELKNEINKLNNIFLCLKGDLINNLLEEIIDFNNDQYNLLKINKINNIFKDIFTTVYKDNIPFSFINNFQNRFDSYLLINNYLFCDIVEIESKYNSSLKYLLNNGVLKIYIKLFSYWIRIKYYYNKIKTSWIYLRNIKNDKLKIIINLFANRLISFFKNFEQYLHIFILNKFWVIFQEKLTNIKTFNDILKIWNDFIFNINKNLIINNKNKYSDLFNSIIDITIWFDNILSLLIGEDYDYTIEGMVNDIRQKFNETLKFTSNFEKFINKITEKIN